MGRPTSAETCQVPHALTGATCFRRRGHPADYHSSGALRWPVRALRSAFGAVGRPPSRPDLHARFLAVVARGLERTAREWAAHLARLRRGRLPAVAIGPGVEAPKK